MYSGKMINLPYNIYVYIQAANYSKKHLQIYRRCFCFKYGIFIYVLCVFVLLICSVDYINSNKQRYVQQ